MPLEPTVTNGHNIRCYFFPHTREKLKVDRAPSQMKADFKESGGKRLGMLAEISDHLLHGFITAMVLKGGIGCSSWGPGTG
jgi:hypothetical protein